MSTKAVMLPRALYRWGLAREHVDYSLPGRLAFVAHDCGAT